MKKLLLTFSILLAFVIPAFGKSKPKLDPLKDFKSSFHSTAFSDVNLAPDGELEFTATDAYINSSPLQQQAYVIDALHAWQAKPSPSEPAQKNQLITVTWKGGGDLWNLQSDKPVKVDQWSDNKLFYSQSNSETGRLFAFFGGQTIQGGGIDITGFNARFGTTLYKNRYDLAATITYASINSTPSVNTNSFGVVGRALFPLSEHVGYNLGGQIVRTEAGGTNEITPGLVAGLNFYAPTGSFDVTLSTIDAGRWSLLAGYTLFFDRE